MAGVALGDIDRHFAWQASHSATSIITLHGRRGTSRPGSSLCVAGVALRSKSSDKYLAAEHPKWGVATADREEIDDWEKFNVTTVHGWDTATLVGWLRCGGGDSGGSYIMVILMGCNGDLMGCNRISW